MFSDSTTTYYRIMEEAIDLMKTSFHKYQEDYGQNHYKTYRAASQLGRLEYLAGHAAPTNDKALQQFSDSNLTFSRLLKTHKRYYKDLNDNYKTDMFNDDSLILHHDIFIDYKYKTMACIYGKKFQEADSCLVHLKKIASMILSQND